MKTLPLGREPEQVTIYIDIETIPAGDEIDPKTLNHPNNIKKQDTIDKWYQDEAPKVAEDMFRKRALNSMEGEIICIGYAINNQSIAFILGKSEEEILRKFEWAILDNLSSTNTAITWIAHNGIKFDFKWLKRKAIKYKIPWLSQSIRPERYGSNCEDTNQLWQCGDYQDYTKLTAIADFLNIPGKNGIDGSMVYDLWIAGEIDKIVDYCMQDVEILRNIYKRIKFLE